MQIGMIGLGRMGANMAQRLMNDGHVCVVFDINTEAVANLAAQGAAGAHSLQDFMVQLSKPRVVWLMLPAAIVDPELTALAPLLEAGDIVIDGGNSFYRDDIRRGAELKQKGIHYVDVGTSGGIAGLEHGYCLMIGGEQEIVSYLRPIFASLAPGVDAQRLADAGDVGGDGWRADRENRRHLLVGPPLDEQAQHLDLA